MPNFKIPNANNLVENARTRLQVGSCAGARASAALPPPSAFQRLLPCDGLGGAVLPPAETETETGTETDKTTKAVECKSFCGEHLAFVCVCAFGICLFVCIWHLAFAICHLFCASGRHLCVCAFGSWQECVRRLCIWHLCICVCVCAFGSWQVCICASGICVFVHFGIGASVHWTFVHWDILFGFIRHSFSH